MVRRSINNFNLPFAVTYVKDKGPQSSEAWNLVPQSRWPRTNMKRGITVLVSLSAVLTVAYFTASKWAIRHEALTFNDPARDNRPVAVDIAVRRDKEMQANAGMIKLPVAILNHRNTVKFTDYAFRSNVLGSHG